MQAVYIQFPQAKSTKIKGETRCDTRSDTMKLCTPFLMLAKEKWYRQTGQNQKDYYPKESNCI